MLETELDPQSVFTVSGLLGGLKRLLADRVGRVWVAGELADVHLARSGHVYFSLADDGGRVRCALFRNAARGLAFEPENGLEVLVYGDVTVYEARGDLQLIARRVEPRGRGALQLAFEQLRRRLEAEGLFDPARKRPLPPTPRRLGIVNSPTGAALHDVLEVTGRRFPAIPILLAPTQVQGDGVEAELAAAVEALATHGGVDLIVIARGGGSIEDLRPFNTEVLARAIAASPVPVVSGVGHEVDVTICDLVADVRAPTPSAAAELAVPDARALSDELGARWRRLVRMLELTLERNEVRLARERDALRALAPTARLSEQRVRLQAAGQALGRVARAHTERARARLGELGGRLDSLSPLAVLARGYGLVRRARDGGIVRTVGDVSAGERLAIRVMEAELEATLDVARAPVKSGKLL
jgi:exodeoxyribonuclease VII large subunit